jgi:thiamine transporter
MEKFKNAHVSRAKVLTVCAVCIAMAFTLNQVSLFRMPQGGSVTPFSMMFVVLAAYWFGPVWGIISGVSMGLLDTITGATVNPINPLVSYILDYPVAFGMLGTAGFFRKWKFGLQIGFIAGVLGRYASVFLSGWIIWGELLPGSAVFSLIYNATYIAPELIATLVIISLPAMKHAIDAVTKNVVSPADYAMLSSKSNATLSPTARIFTGATIGAIGGIGFVLASYIQRLENLSISHVANELVLFADPPRADRLYRMVERNTEQIFALQTVGVIFISIGVGLLVSAIISGKE